MAYLLLVVYLLVYYGQVLLLNVKLWLLVVPLNIQLDFAYGLIIVKSYEFKIRLSTNHTNVFRLGFFGLWPMSESYCSMSDSDLLAYGFNFIHLKSYNSSIRLSTKSYNSSIGLIFA